MISAHNPGANGEPGSNPLCAGAVTCLRQQEQTPLWRLMRVTLGLIAGTHVIAGVGPFCPSVTQDAEIRPNSAGVKGQTQREGEGHFQRMPQYAPAGNCDERQLACKDSRSRRALWRGATG